jgi:membrane-bound metal-dependent hydrolase YbcI (DUF457 family)
MSWLPQVGMRFCDTALGILATFLVAYLYHISPTPLLFAVGVISAHLPDADSFLDPHFWRRGYVAAYADNPYDHRETLHKPLLWVLGIGTLYVFMSSLHAYIVLVGLGVMLHFIHDTVGTGWGIPWLWPFTRTRYKLFATKENKALSFQLLTSWKRDELTEYIRRYGIENWVHVYYSRWSSVAILEMCVVVSSCMVTLTHYL